jgi:Ca-activated chloride channel family protein
MKLLPEDPRLTAYALGEIEDESERQEIEAAVNASPELQQAVAAIQDLGTMLGAGFAAESGPELSEFEKAKLEAEPVAKQLKGRLLTWPILTSVAAIVLLAIVLVPQFTQQEATFTYQAPARQDPTEVVSQETLPVLTPSRSAETAGGTTLEEAVEISMTPETGPVIAEGSAIVVNDFLSFDGFIDSSVVNSSGDGDAGLAIDQIETSWLFEPPADSSSMPAAQSTRESQPMVPAVPARALGVSAAKQAPVESILVADFYRSTSEFDTGAVSRKPQGETIQRSSSPGLEYSKREDFMSPTVNALRSVARDETLGDVDLSRQRPAFSPRPEPVSTQNTENYDTIEESDFRSPLVAPLSTFSIDVDTASYANVRRFLNQGQLPPADAVRIEELINYFSYDDAAPSESLAEGGDPFVVHMAQMYAPWNTETRLLRIALKGYEMPWEARPASNLVFLLDVSGSMNQQNKLPLVKESLDLLVRRLDKRDRVAIVVYAGASGLVLPSTTADNHETIAHAMNNLSAGGSTNAGAGIELAYKTARKHFIQGGNNRVILCTDGDFNVGQTNRGNLADIAEKQAEGGISLTVLGFGMGNLKDGMLETLSNKGKGTYAYVDSQSEARKVFLEDLASNIFKIAKDVKIQVEFNPTQVKAYRLIGYENRRLKAEDFNNDAKKAGDIGPGHSIVALYEIVPTSAKIKTPSVDALRYQQVRAAEQIPGELATVKLRYKQPDGEVSKLIARSVQSEDLVEIKQASDDLRFSAAVAAFGLKLSGSKHVAEYGFDSIENLAINSLGQDPGGHRSEFTELVRKASLLDKE